MEASRSSTASPRSIVGSGSYDFRVQPDADPERDVWVTLAPLTEPVVRGEHVAGSIVVTNWGGVPDHRPRGRRRRRRPQITGDLHGRRAGARGVDRAASSTPPSRRTPRLGDREVEVVLTFTSDGQDYEVTETTTWAEIVAGVAVDGVTGSVTDPSGQPRPGRGRAPQRGHPAADRSGAGDGARRVADAAGRSDADPRAGRDPHGHHPPAGVAPRRRRCPAGRGADGAGRPGPGHRPGIAGRSA